MGARLLVRTLYTLILPVALHGLCSYRFTVEDIEAQICLCEQLGLALILVCLGGHSWPLGTLPYHLPFYAPWAPGCPQSFPEEPGSDCVVPWHPQTLCPSLLPSTDMSLAYVLGVSSTMH